MAWHSIAQHSTRSQSKAKHRQSSLDYCLSVLSGPVWSGTSTRCAACTLQTIELGVQQARRQASNGDEHGDEAGRWMDGWVSGRERRWRWRPWPWPGGSKDEHDQLARKDRSVAIASGAQSINQASSQSINQSCRVDSIVKLRLELRLRLRLASPRFAYSVRRNLPKYITSPNQITSAPASSCSICRKSVVQHSLIHSLTHVLTCSRAARRTRD